MSDPVSKFLKQHDRDAIGERVRLAEERTSGEIVVMVVASSHHYPLANIIGGVLAGLLAAVVTALLTGREHMWDFLGFFLLFFILFNELFRRVWFLKKLFVRPGDMDEEVEETAIASFYKKEVYNTRDHSGILLYISLFEHRVRVVADKGISAVVSQAEWDTIVQRIIQAIRTGKQAEAIMEAVDMCGDILSKHFPSKPDDTNELDNSVIIGH
ncbi:MAG: TPM domain-containing protein [Prosthecochloris sp.]|uniref:TPM domain-containing protein n=1 Tax=Prosthecochloris aestuarii (strain DSM 271 / SK 413) TaxID=290512 RepID=B4S442_PROA2|nr:MULTISPECIES: TPM domain-containing protein [Prosthecochloris]ACF46834.1 protein of unknown function DUF477 [Prosthecochloris aestuarii DSM 271]MCW8799070.1 TPM domain-containing protein [Prosthecochloris sp.]NEX12886.1 hypothetical protein [Prosthecochloris sp.]